MSEPRRLREATYLLRSIHQPGHAPHLDRLGQDPEGLGRLELVKDGALARALLEDVLELPQDALFEPRQEDPDDEPLGLLLEGVGGFPGIEPGLMIAGCRQKLAFRFQHQSGFDRTGLDSRRLRLSEPFRPLQYLAWEQGGDAPFPTVRVHDLEVILSVEPAAAGLTTAEPQELAPAPDQDPAHSATVVPADVAEAPPIRHYRLDGAASLTRSRFLHLSIAVELREPLYEGTAAAGAGPRTIDSRDVSPDASMGGVPDAPEQPAPTGFLVHELVQSRVVRTGRMEYFDGPVLGVLAWVTDISETVAERPLE